MMVHFPGLPCPAQTHLILSLYMTFAQTMKYVSTTARMDETMTLSDASESGTQFQ